MVTQHSFSARNHAIGLTLYFLKEMDGVVLTSRIKRLAAFNPEVSGALRRVAERMNTWRPRAHRQIQFSAHPFRQNAAASSIAGSPTAEGRPTS